MQGVRHLVSDRERIRVSRREGLRAHLEPAVQGLHHGSSGTAYTASSNTQTRESGVRRDVGKHISAEYRRAYGGFRVGDRYQVL